MAAGVAAQLSSIIDGADGMLARARGECSAFGSHLDLFLDRVVDFSIFAGIAVGAGRYFQAPHLLTLGLLATALYQLQIILFYLTKSYLKSEERGDTGEARAVLYWAVFLFAVTGRVDLSSTCCSPRRSSSTPSASPTSSISAAGGQLKKPSAALDSSLPSPFFSPLALRGARQPRGTSVTPSPT